MSTDTAELDLSYVEAERIRQLSERAGGSSADRVDEVDLEHLDPASRAEAIVAEVLANARSIDDLVEDLHIDLDREPEGSAAAAPVAEPAPLVLDRPARTHVVLRDREPALVLVPGEAVEADRAAYVPEGTVARHPYGPLVDRAIEPLRGSVRVLTAHLGRTVGERRQLTRWILAAAVWAAAVAALVPLAFTMLGTSLDVQVDLFPEGTAPATDTGVVEEVESGTATP